MPGKKHLTRREAMAQRAAAAAPTSSSNTKGTIENETANEASSGPSSSRKTQDGSSQKQGGVHETGEMSAWETFQAATRQTQPSSHDEDWLKSYGRDTEVRALTWTPDLSDRAADENLDMVEASMRIFHQVKDHATKYRKTFIASSPFPRWLLGAIGQVRFVVATYEEQGEGSLTSYRRHVLDLARRGARELEEMKSSEEKRAGPDVWRVVDPETGELHPPRGEEDLVDDFEKLFRSKIAQPQQATPPGRAPTAQESTFGQSPPCASSSNVTASEARETKARRL